MVTSGGSNLEAAFGQQLPADIAKVDVDCRNVVDWSRLVVQRRCVAQRGLLERPHGAHFDAADAACVARDINREQAPHAESPRHHGGAERSAYRTHIAVEAKLPQRHRISIPGEVPVGGENRQCDGEIVRRAALRQVCR